MLSTMRSSYTNSGSQSERIDIVHNIVMMSAATPKLKHDALVTALAELPPGKIERFAIALGVPKRVIETSRINNPHDIDRVKSDTLSWWVANEEASWEAVANALEATGVDERNMAKQVRSSHGIHVNGIINYRKS